MSKSKLLKFSLKLNEVNAAFGENVELSADLSTVKEVFVGAVDTLGVQKCLALGGAAAVAATATYVLVKAMAQKWPWAKVTNVEGNSIQVTVPQDKDGRLAGLIQENKLHEKLADDFENMEDNLEGILREEYKTHGSEVAKLLKDVRLASISLNKNSDLPENVEAQRAIFDEVEKIARGDVNVFTTDGNSTGTKAQTFVGKGGKLKEESYGVTNIMTSGLRGEDHATTMKTVKKITGNMRVEIRGDGLKKMMVVELKPTNTVEDVRMEVEERAKLEKKIVMMRNEEKLPDEMTLAEANRHGLVWRAKFVD